MEISSSFGSSPSSKMVSSGLLEEVLSRGPGDAGVLSLGRF